MAKATPKTPSRLAAVAAERRSSTRTPGRGTVSRSDSPSASSSTGEDVDDWRAPRTGGKPGANTWHCTLDGCTKFFMREADLKRHQRTSRTHNKKSYYCVCGRAFTRLDATRRHCVSFGHDFPAALRLAAGDDDLPDEASSPASGLALLVAAAETLSSGHKSNASGAPSETDGEDSASTSPYDGDLASSQASIASAPDARFASSVAASLLRHRAESYPGPPLAPYHYAEHHRRPERVRDARSRSPVHRQNSWPVHY